MTNFIIVLIAAIAIVSVVSILKKDIVFFCMGIPMAILCALSMLYPICWVIAVVLLFGFAIGVAIWRIKKGLD